MKIEEKIAGLCLYGFIRDESPAEQKRCMREIRLNYGTGIASVVRHHLKKG
ncbi:MAG: hypothetical protein JW807_14700 [Spirochaetes bacterium]|nr:hypothetical protein [Spirochaetota bacterium]